MSKALLIAEKPSLMKEIKNVYDKHKSSFKYTIDFAFQAGHIVALKKPSEIDESQKKWCWENLPFFPENYGGWQYQIIPDKIQLFNELKNKITSGKYDFIIHAGDPDQEGQLLCNLLLMYAKNKLPVKRFWTNDLTEPKILDALMNLRDNDNEDFLKNLGSAALARQHSDYKIGMNISQAASLKMKDTCAIGRVKTPLLKIIVDRELDIRNFKPVTTYELQSNYKEKFNGILFTLEDGNIMNTKFKTKEDCLNFSKNLDNFAKVISVDKKTEKTSAPSLFKLSTLQTEAGKLGYEASQVLGLAQSLYEKKFLSYPRTNCEFLASGLNFRKMLDSVSVFPEFKLYTDKITSKEIDNIKKNKKYINDVKLKESGHYALSPTELKPDLKILNKDETIILKLIFRQFLAIFLPPLVQDKTVIITENKKNTFRTTGKILKDKGYSIIFDTNFNDIVLPDVNIGDIVNVDKFEAVERTTTCPPRFTDGSLVDLMDNPIKYLEDESLKNSLKNCKGIGTPATRDSIINQLADKDNCIEKKKGKGKSFQIYATEKGIQLIQNLGDRDICKVDLTGMWEEKLEKIRTGENTLESLEKEMDEYVINLINDIKNSDMNIINKTKGTIIGKCPVCGKNVIETEKYYRCENYKKEDGCTFILGKVTAGKTIPQKEFLKLLEQKPTSKMKFKKPNSKDTFETCLIFDKDKGKIVFDFGPKASNEILGKCPKCGKNILDKGSYCCCENYKKDCNFAISYKIKNAELSIDDIKNILTDKETSFKDFSFGKAKIKYNKDKEKLDFIFDNGENIGICPKCGKTVLDKGKYCKCENCDFSISYNIKGTKITKTDIKNILTNKETSYKKFSFGEAKLKYNKDKQKLDFISKPK